MFKNTYQNGLLSIFYSCGADPLAIWDKEVKNGHIKRLTDNEVNSVVLEIVSTNVATTYISCPKNNKVLGIKLPFLVMIVKNLKRYFSFEIMILDDKNMRRRFRISNFQSSTKIKPFCTSMPIGLAGGWNQIQFNLADFTRRAYGTQFIETLRVQIHANVRLRRIYFSEKLYSEEELPQEYKLYLPLERKQKKLKAEVKTDKKKDDVSAPVGEIISEAEHPVERKFSRKSTGAVTTPTSEDEIKIATEIEDVKGIGEATEQPQALEKSQTIIAEGQESESTTEIDGEKTIKEGVEIPHTESEVLEDTEVQTAAPESVEGEATSVIVTDAPADEPSEENQEEIEASAKLEEVDTAVEE